MRTDVQRGPRHRHVRRLAVFLIMAALALRAVNGGESDRSGADAAQKRVQHLAEALADARAENDRLRAQLDRRRFDEAGETGAMGEVDRVAGWRKDYRILEINEELGIAVVNAGRRQGLRPGLRFTAIRGDQVIAVLRVIDVRAQIAGAVVEATHGKYPKAQDRLAPATGTGE